MGKYSPKGTKCWQNPGKTKPISSLLIMQKTPRFNTSSKDVETSGPHYFRDAKEADEKFPNGVPMYVDVHECTFKLGTGAGQGWRLIFGWYKSIAKAAGFPPNPLGAGVLPEPVPKAHAKKAPKAPKGKAPKVPKDKAPKVPKDKAPKVPKDKAPKVPKDKAPKVPKKAAPKKTAPAPKAKKIPPKPKVAPKKKRAAPATGRALSAVPTPPKKAGGKKDAKSKDTASKLVTRRTPARKPAQKQLAIL